MSGGGDGLADGLAQTRAALAVLMREQPALHNGGLYFRGAGGADLLAELRAELAANVEQVHAVIAWLTEHVGKRATINTTRTSYGLKHLAEPWIGYVTNGAFVAGAMIAGYSWHQHYMDVPNVRFGMSERSLRKLDYEVAS